MKTVREIGSEFWDVPTTDKENGIFPESTQWFLSGRSALQAIIEAIHGVRSVAMPAWCCDSMIKPFVDAGIAVQFYPVYPQKGLVQEIQQYSDVLFIMDYFGYSTRSSATHPCIIRDITHTLFSVSYDDADFYFGSLRKWCGIWTGGYAWGGRLNSPNDTEEAYTFIRRRAMSNKAQFIYNGEKGDKSYLGLFEEAEDLLNYYDIAGAAQRDIEIAPYLDVEYIKSRRRANARVLMNAFSDQLLFSELGQTDTPMFVPILVPEGQRNALRQYLIKHAIYCPIHWPISRYHQMDEKTRIIYDNELSLVCDQRYCEEDMSRMIETINKFWKEAN